MATRMTAHRWRALRLVWEAGSDGLAAATAPRMSALIRGGLVTTSVDPSRILAERYRLTWAGERYARVFFEKEGARS